MNKYLCLLVLVFSELLLFAQAPTIVNVRNWGAKGDGITSDTEAIQKAIDHCAANGGGTVWFPAGQYVTSTLFLKDNITLDIPGGTTILGDIDIKNYPVITPKIPYYSSENIHFSLFYAEGKKNISLKGSGTIDGRGSHFKDASSFFPKNYNARPFIFWFVQIKNISVKDLHLQNSGFWMQHYLNCEDVLIDGINVFNHSNKNNDMMDIDGCKNVRIINCIGDSDDDGITLKSMNEYPVENVVISNCIVSSHCNAIKCGTESSGGFKNITITNCVVKPSVVSDKAIYGNPRGNSGITLATVDGGQLDGIVINNIRIDGPQVPIFLRLGNRARPFKKDQEAVSVGTLRNVQISNIVATGASKLGCLLAGLPEHAIENVHLTNIFITFAGGGTSEDARRLLPENEKKYPDAEQFGINNAYGFQVRHARNISLKNIRLYYDNAEDRPALVLDDVNHGIVEGVTAMLSAQSDAFVKVMNCGKLSITHCIPLLNATAKVFLKLAPNLQSDIVLMGNDLRGFPKVIDVPKETGHKVTLIGNVEK